MPKIIYHIDVNNAFLSWSAVYLLEHGYAKDIRQIPSIIGGDESKRRGIVLAKSPVAKKYGITTAETIYSARQKCPTVQIFPPLFEWYYEESNKLFNYLANYTPVIERYSVDECFLDMTGTNFLYKDYIELAYKIKNEIKNKFGFTVNIGIAQNKLCAKMASDFEKPDKVHTLFPSEIKEKMWPLSVKDLFMVGKSTAAELMKLNIKTIGDLANANITTLKKRFKNQALFLHNSANGIDYTNVEYHNSKNKSLSITETLAYDYTDIDKIKEILLRQSEEIGRELRTKKMYAKTVAIIYKNSLFQTYSHQEKLTSAINKSEDIYQAVVNALSQSWKEEPIRLIGIRLNGLTYTIDSQLSLFEKKDNCHDERFQELIDNINNKFGKNAVMKASIKKIGISNAKIIKITK